MSDVVKPGDIVLMRVLKMTAAPKPIEAALDQIPEVQGALTAIDPATRRVVAISGGYDLAVPPFHPGTPARGPPRPPLNPRPHPPAARPPTITPGRVANTRAPRSGPPRT